MERKCNCTYSGAELPWQKCLKHGIRTFYLRGERPKPTPEQEKKGIIPQGPPIACVAYRVIDAQIKYAVAGWNPHYPMSKSLARQVAVGRLEKLVLAGSINEGPEAKRRLCMTLLDGHISAKNKPSASVALGAQCWLEDNPPGQAQKEA